MTLGRPLPQDPLEHLGGPDNAKLLLPRLMSRSKALAGKAQIVPGVELSYELSLDRSRLDVDVVVGGLTVHKTTFDPQNLCDRVTAHQGPFKEDLELCVDLFRGELEIEGQVCVWDPEKNAYNPIAIDKTVLIAWSPTLGTVGGSPIAHPPQLTDPGHGDSASVVPNITRIPVDETKRIGTPVGSLVKRRFFSHVPDFVFNVCFSVGPFKPLMPGAYGDPTSPWFNVFAGYYEIDTPKPAWKRPFGYDLSNGKATIHFDDLKRIAKADWNWFSNWMYGVPEASIEPFNQLDPDTKCEYLGRRPVGRKSWDLVDIDGFSAVSAYQSNAQGAARLADNTLLTQLWRVTYGEPKSVSGHDTSFVGTNMHARLYMAYEEEDTMFRTFIFGGTVNKAFDGPANDQFMQSQLAACYLVLTSHYPRLGFAP